MRQRRETVEHPFGTIKARMGATHFLMKTLPRVTSEMALHVLAYNITRVIEHHQGVRPLHGGDDGVAFDLKNQTRLNNPEHPRAAYSPAFGHNQDPLTDARSSRLFRPLLLLAGLVEVTTEHQLG